MTITDPAPGAPATGSQDPGADRADGSVPAASLATSVPLDPTGRTRLSRLRIPAAIVGFVLLIALLTAAIEARSQGGYLDPGSASPAGGMALRVLLQNEGVQVSTASSAAAAGATPSDGTLFVASADLLSGRQLDELAGSSADLVLVDPSTAALSALAPQLQPADSVPDAVRQPDCDLHAATLAGSALTGGLSFSGAQTNGPGVQLCYDAGAAWTVAVLTASGGRTVTVLGSGTAFTNGELGNDGNAALALDLLGQRVPLTWYVATPDPGGGGASTSQLLPGWVKTATLQLAFAVVLLALWRGRRLGRVVEEPLPVVVRSAESTEGRGRLYRRSRSRGRAAEHLRTATVARLVPLLGLAQGADRSAVCSAVATRSGWDAAAVDQLLYGSAPSDDPALVRLATDLDTLERTVGRG